MRVRSTTATEIACAPPDWSPRFLFGFLLEPLSGPLHGGDSGREALPPRGSLGSLACPAEAATAFHFGTPEHRSGGSSSRLRRRRRQLARRPRRRWERWRHPYDDADSESGLLFRGWQSSDGYCSNGRFVPPLLRAQAREPRSLLKLWACPRR